MNIALFENQRVSANPVIKNAICPLCKNSVITKCGTINVWHFAHKSNIECDKWSEHESEWHIGWKNYFPKNNQEIIIKPHIADILTDDNIVIELQNSSISPKEIEERENFYDKMIWIFNGETFGKGINFRKKLEKDIITFRWKHPPKSLWSCKKSIYIDLGTYILYIKRIYQKIPCGAYGKLILKDDFIKKYRGSNGREQT